MSALGQNQTCTVVQAISGPSPITDIGQRYGSFVIAITSTSTSMPGHAS
jgi:hypothetical protein